MASLQPEHTADTVKSRLRRFSVHNMLFCIILAAVMIAFGIFTEATYERTSRQQQHLNRFYQQLEIIHTNTTKYASDGTSEDVEQLVEQYLSGIHATMTALQKMQIDQTYRRDITDLSHMLSNYADSVHRVFSEASGSTNLSSAYYRADKIYEAMNAEFRNLYSQILDYTGEVMEQTRRSARIFILAVAAAITISLILGIRRSGRLSRHIVRPVEELTSSIEGFNLQNVAEYEHVSISADAPTEMNVLVRVFNTMLETIHNQIEQIRRGADIEIRLHQQEIENLKVTNLLHTSQLKALQMQINPHFLFNTLNMISQTAYVECADRTVALIDQTSVLLRYSLDFAARQVPLSQEIEMLGIYVSLLEQRFAGRIRFVFELDEHFHSVKVPALILQPLVENAVNHGVGMYVSGGEVTIRTRQLPEEGKALMAVEDNGAGMDADTLAKVTSDMKDPENAEKKIGLANVYGRLQIFFHGQADMTIQSDPGKCTAVTIIIPLEENRGPENRSM